MTDTGQNTEMVRTLSILLQYGERQAAAAERQADALERLSGVKPAQEAGGPIMDPRLKRAMLLTMQAHKPRKSEIARQMGYRSHSALDKIPGFNDFFDTWEAARSLVKGSGRSAVKAKDGDHTLSDDEIY